MKNKIKALLMLTTLLGAFSAQATITENATPVMSSTRGADLKVALANATQIQRTQLTITDHTLSVAGTTGVGFGSAKIFDFPEGRILVFGVLVENLVFTPGTGLDTADNGDFSIGTTAADDGTVDGADVNLFASTGLTPLPTSTDGALAATPAHFDGTTTAVDAYLNVLIDDADIGATVADNTVSATVTITWINLGDY